MSGPISAALGFKPFFGYCERIFTADENASAAFENSIESFENELESFENEIASSENEIEPIENSFGSIENSFDPREYRKRFLNLRRPPPSIKLVAAAYRLARPSRNG